MGEPTEADMREMHDLWNDLHCLDPCRSLQDAREDRLAIAKALEEARAEGHVAGRDELAEQLDSYFRRFEKRTEELVIEDRDEHVLYHQGRAAAYEDAAEMTQVFLAKLPEAP